LAQEVAVKGVIIIAESDETETRGACLQAMSLLRPIATLHDVMRDAGDDNAGEASHC
jgi:hypothetical protein